MDLLDEALLGGCVGERVSGHVEKNKALFLCGQDSLFHEVLGYPLSNVADLIA